MNFPTSFATARLRLRRACLADAPALFEAYTADPEVSRFLTWTPHCAVADTEAYLRSVVAAAEAGRAATFLLARAGDPRPIGAVDLRQETPFRLGVGYVLARAHWGQGLMSEVLGEVLRWAAGEPGIWRVWSFCDVENIGSARVMEHAGMAFEGVLRRWFVHPNIGAAPRDCRAYAWVRSPEARSARQAESGRVADSSGRGGSSSSAMYSSECPSGSSK